MFKLMRRRESYFDDLFDSFFREPSSSFLKTDIKESEDNYELIVDVPGFNKEEIEVKLENGYLAISASKEKEEDLKDEYFVRRERIHSSAIRKFYVGEGLTEDQIEAKLEKGVLTIKVPKEQERVTTEKIIKIK